MENERSPETQEQIRSAVREGYGRIAQSEESCDCGPASCCGSGSARRVAQAVGYSEAELAALPEGANMGLSCGNPTAIASLEAGEVVLDLGSGGGFDAFIAGQKVGPSGRVIGVDMTAEMLAKARRNIAAYRERAGLDNVEFRLGEIEHLPVADASVDAVLSNCVLNLSPDKPQVWREIARVLKPGGRVAISDLALLRPLPEAVREMFAALIGCVAGAAPVEETRAMIEAAGLTEIVLTPKPEYIEAMSDWKDPLYRRIIEHLPPGSSVSDTITSLDIAARKSEQPSACCGQPQSVYNLAVAELVAVGAAIASNCEPCFKYHYGEARKRGIAREDIARAVAMAQAVKEAPAQAILKMAEQYLECNVTAREAGAPPKGTCCAASEQPAIRVAAPNEVSSSGGCRQ